MAGVDIAKIENAVIYELLAGLSEVDKEFCTNAAGEFSRALMLGISQARGHDGKIAVHDVGLAATIARVASHGLNATYRGHLK